MLNIKEIKNKTKSKIKTKVKLKAKENQKENSKYINSESSDYDISDDDKEAIILYYKSLLIGFVVDWISSGMRYDLGDKIKRICEIFDGSMERALIKSSRSHKDNQ